MLVANALGSLHVCTGSLGGYVVVGLLFNVLPIICASSVFVSVWLKRKFTLVLKCIYYRAYSMIGIIIHLKLHNL